MTEILPVTVLLAVKNEEANVRKCLSSLYPANEIIVIDSYSTDKTTQIAKVEYEAEVIQFDYQGGYPKKRQWALENIPLKNDWILLLDADEEIPTELWKEIREVTLNTASSDGYLIRKGFHFLGKKFKYGGFSHNAVILFRKGTCRFEELISDVSSGLDMEVHERVIVNGTLGRLKTPLVHMDFKGLEAYIDRHNKYSSWEARLRFLNRQNRAYGSEAITANLLGNSQERRRFLKQIIVRMPFEPLIWFTYHFILRLGFLEGRPGLIASQLRAAYIAQVRAKIYELESIEKRPSQQ